MRSRPVRMDKVFDDPEAILRLVRELAPYDTVGCYYNGGVADPKGIDPPWFLIEPDIPVLVENPNWIAAAHEAFDAGIVKPIRCVINLNPPAPASSPHLDLPVFRGFSAPQVPIWLLMSMANSGLFLDWLVPLASGVAWLWRGAGGEFEYWPNGPADNSLCEKTPMWNTGVMADNEVMWHRVGAIGTAQQQASSLATVPGDARMHWSGEGWEARQDDRPLARFSMGEVRISCVWKAYVFRDEAHVRSFEDRAYDLDLDTVVDMLSADLAKRGLPSRRPSDPLDDAEWRQLLAGTYTTPFSNPTAS
jgi:hypothetical protein